MRTQDELEFKMSEDGKHRFWKNEVKWQERGRASESSWGRELFRQAIPIFTNAYEEWADKALRARAGYSNTVPYLLQELKPELICLIAAKVIIDGMTKRQMFTSIANAIASSLELELMCLKASDKVGAVNWNKLKARMIHSVSSAKAKDIYYKNRLKTLDINKVWSLSDKIQIGTVLLHLFKESTGIVEFCNITNIRKKFVTMVQMTDETEEWIKKLTGHLELLRPFKYPMKEKPVNWASLFGGGYKLATSAYPLIKNFSKHHQESFVSLNVLAAVNALQNTGWKINCELLQVAETYFKSGKSVNDLLPMNGQQEIPPKPHDIETNVESRKEWRTKAHAIYSQNANNKARFVLVAKTLSIAREFQNESSLYFPVQLDFRGRMYYVPESLNPQGNDLAKALLLFSNSKKLTNVGVKALLIHGANKFGVDKATFEERLKFVAENENSILRCASDPYAETWWTLAEEPWQFLAFCFEYARFKATGEQHESFLPCSVDASNNGIQILSLLVGDETLAKKTNVFSSEEVIHDLYTDTAAKLKELLPELAPLINRNTVKTSIMCLPYGITVHGMAEAIDEHLKKQLFNNPALLEILPYAKRRAASFQIASVLKNELKHSLKRLLDCMGALRQFAALCVNNNCAPQWQSPSGFVVLSRYPKRSKIRVITRLGSKLDERELFAPQETGLSKTDTISAFPANLVHSLDAAVAHLVCSQFPHPLGAVHDCFVAHAATLAELGQLARGVYQEIFSAPVLKNTIKQVFEPMPKNVYLDATKNFSFPEKICLESIGTSPYFFH